MEINSVVKIINNQVDSKEITDLEKEFLLYYWDKLRKEHLSKLSHPIIWIPHLGKFTMSEMHLEKSILGIVKVLREFYAERKRILEETGSLEKSLAYKYKTVIGLKEDFKTKWNAYKKVRSFHLKRKNEIYKNKNHAVK